MEDLEEQKQRLEIQEKKLELQEKKIRRRTIWATVLIPVLTAVISYFTTLTTINVQLDVNKLDFTQEQIDKLINSEDVVDSRRKIHFLLKSRLIGNDRDTTRIKKALSTYLVKRGKSNEFFIEGVIKFDLAYEFDALNRNNPYIPFLQDSAVKNYRVAIAKFNEALELDPDNFEAQVFLGNAYHNLGEILALETLINKALAEYNEVLKLKPELGYLYIDRASAYSFLSNDSAVLANVKLSEKYPIFDTVRIHMRDSLRFQYGGD